MARGERDPDRSLQLLGPRDSSRLLVVARDDAEVIDELGGRHRTFSWATLASVRLDVPLSARSSMSQELFVSVNQLLEMSRAKGSTYNHIVIEASGIAEPKSVRSVFQDAETYQTSVMEQARYVLDSTRMLERWRKCSYGLM